MAKRTSAGILVHRRLSGGSLELLLVHPGGPYFRKKDAGWWTIPKGEPDDGEALEAAAARELREELGLEATGELVALGSVRQKGGKEVHAWAMVGNLPDDWAESWDPAGHSTFEIEWPPRSGRRQSFPEVDRAEWFGVPEALEKINAAQRELIERLVALQP